MKKKISILLICLMMSFITACGKEDDKAEDVSAEVKTEVEATESDDTEKDVEVEVSGKLKADMTDFVLGKDIPVDDVHRFSLSVFPDVHILLPSDDVRDVTEEWSLNRTFTEVTLKNGQKIMVKFKMIGHEDEHCVARHIDRLELGRYSIDYSWCTFTLEDYQTQTAVRITLSYAEYDDQKDFSDDFTPFITDLTKENVDYLEKQVGEWGDDYTPPASEENADAEPDTDENDGLLECDIIPCGTFDLDGNRYAIISTYDDDSGDCMLMFGCYDGTFSGGDYYDLELIENDTYSAKNYGSDISVTVTFSDDGIDVSGGTGELAEFNGHYTLQQ